MSNNWLTPIMFQIGVMVDSVYFVPNISTALYITLLLFTLSFVRLAIFFSSMLHCCAHAVTSAAFAAVQLGADGSQLLLAWIAMRIPFPIGSPVNSLLNTQQWYYLIISSLDLVLPTLPITHPSVCGRRRCCQPVCRHHSSYRQR